MQSMSYLPKDEKRKAILEATLSLVVSCGFAGITARKVAAEMGAATGTIHHHFSSLDELKTEVIRYAISSSVDSDLEAIKGLPPYEALQQMLLPSNFPDREFENRVWLSAADEMWRNEQLKTVYCESMISLTDLIEGVITLGQQQGLFDPALDSRQCAWKLMATSFTLSNYSYLGDSSLNLTAIDELVINDIRLTLGIKDSGKTQRARL
ncbi:TetR family transcriptional regulator [Endozoicomonas sp. GU-1]|uniref:TetR family transcriptional regulator n=2 Tax=Endozoicomonas sp. GU-1 TaxID=3009078 RepID=UPI0022B5B3BE|nr:TetR family transcriptional regulator [Endozoicomonas sp. GU-1]WBA79886.1 TetR family transcriptional regulator [Endozoicomonas sp. GU-1]